MGGKTMKNKLDKRNKLASFLHYATLPIRVLGKTHEFYVRTMLDCAGGMSGNMVVAPFPAPPRNFSKDGGRDMEELREVIRVMSLKNSRRVAAVGGGMGRCYSVGVGKIGKIDEELACHFEEADVVNKDLVSRCRSYHTTKRNLAIP